MTKFLFKKESYHYAFDAFKKYVDYHGAQGPSPWEENTKDWLEHLDAIFSYFCTEVFEFEGKGYYDDETYDSWGGNFPAEWKITFKNIENNYIARIVLNKFGAWASDQIFGNKGNLEHDDRLGKVVAGLFPGVRLNVFQVFLMLFFSSSILKAAIEKKWYPLFQPIELMRIREEGEDTVSQIKREWHQQEMTTCELIIDIFGWPSGNQSERKGKLLEVKKQLGSLEQVYGTENEKEANRKALEYLIDILLEYIHRELEADKPEFLGET